MIIDAHAHSGDFLGRIWDAKKIISVMDKYKIDKAFISSETAIINGDPEANMHLYENYLKFFPDRLIGYCVPNPYHNPGDEVIKCIDSGHFKGIKLHPWHQKCPLISQFYEPVFRIANEKKLPVLVHSGGTLIQPDLCFALPDMFLNIADKYKDISLIIGHMGLERWRQVIEIIHDYKNIFLDITMSKPNPDRLEFAVKKIGANRVLFGTDLPLLDPAVSLGLIYGSSLTSEEREKVMGNNIMNLLNNTNF